ncbi:two component regulator propeller domain-containing protein [Candidatus Magnetoovum chiemensis]|nr:two component regulator propeller domain-containing protein [Candidatus Magnetoovum chiemensis]
MLINANKTVNATFNSSVVGSKAIVVAGSGPSNNSLWGAIEANTNLVYITLTYQGFTKDSIYFLSSGDNIDVDGNGFLDDIDGEATNSNVQYAITDWAADAGDVIIYMIGHGGTGSFKMGEQETLDATTFASWLNTLQTKIAGKIVFVYEACLSGSFVSSLNPPSGKERIIITSASETENAYFISDGLISFSHYFWYEILSGEDVYDSFVTAKNAIKFITANGQSPTIEDNANGIPNEKTDGSISTNFKIGSGITSAADIPVIGTVSPEQTIASGISATISAENITTTGSILKVWAVIKSPDFEQGFSEGTPVTSMPTIDLTDTGGGVYTAEYNGFNVNGAYLISIFAKDDKNNISLPATTTVIQETALCSYTINPKVQTNTSDTGSGSVTVTPSDSSCAWTAASNASWITVNSGASGTGSGTVGYTVSANTGIARIGTITTAGKDFIVAQTGAQIEDCTISLSPQNVTISSESTEGNIVVLASSSNCAWSTNTSASWLTVTDPSGGTGTGDGTIAYSADANSSVSSRVGVIMVNNQPFQLTQKGACTYSLSPVVTAIQSTGSSSESVTVTSSDSSCTWVAITDVDWITVNPSSSSGTGAGTVGFSVNANTSGAMRTGKVMIDGQNFIDSPVSRYRTV